MVTSGQRVWAQAKRCVATCSKAHGASRGPVAGPRGSRTGEALSCRAKVSCTTAHQAAACLAKAWHQRPMVRGGRQAVRRTLAFGRTPRSVVFEVRHDDLLNDDQQVMAEAQQKTGQHRERFSARCAEPALDADPVDLELIFGFTPVEAVTDTDMGCAAGWATLWSGKAELVEMRDVILDSAAKVQYDGHLFVLNPTSRTAAKRSPGGRVPPFSGRMNGPAYLTSRGPANPTTRPTTPRRDPASAPLPAPSVTPAGVRQNKRPPLMDDLATTSRRGPPDISAVLARITLNYRSPLQPCFPGPSKKRAVEVRPALTDPADFCCSLFPSFVSKHNRLKKQAPLAMTYSRRGLRPNYHRRGRA